MEACFLSSNSVTKATELKPLIKHKLFNPLKKYSSLYNYKPGISPSVACCQLGSSSSSSDEDDIRPIINGDWRSFRARLVAEERISSRFENPSSSSIRADPPKLSTGDKWAHPIHQPEKGCLLIATKKLDGVHIFERTVILVLSTGPVGPTGIILNRPSLMSIKETKSTASDLFSDQPLFFGGPLEGGLFLVTGPNDEVGRSGVFEEVMRGLHYGSKESLGCAAEMVKRNMVGLSDIRFFDGYCGWEKDQLKEEIQAGYWTLAACSPSVIGLESESCGGMWKEVLGLMGPRMVW